MRIQDRERIKNKPLAGGSVGKANAAASSGKDFSDIMQRFQPPDWEVNLGELLKKLDELGQRLIQSFSIYDLKSYKDTLRNFLNETFGKAYKLNEETSWSKSGRTRVYQVIEKINGELEELSILVLSKQKDQMKLLAKLDQIRGLMVDLYS